MSSERFRQLLENHREDDDIVKAFEQIERAPDEAEQVILATEVQLEEDFGVDIQRQARGTLRLHRELNDQLERLATGEDSLTAEEQLKRRIVRIMRAMEKTL